MNPNPGQEDQNPQGYQRYSDYPPPPPGYSQPGPAALGSNTQGFSLADLLQRWRAVLTGRSVQTFDAQLPSANWPTIWINLAIYAVFGGVVRALETIINPTTRSGTVTFSNGLPVTNFISTVILDFIGFFILTGVLYLLARVVFKGSGTFLGQSYLLSLIVVPLGIATAILTPIPILGSLALFAFAIYQIYLFILAIASAHRLPKSRAAGVVLIPVMFLLALLLVTVLLILLLAAVLPPVM